MDASLFLLPSILADSDDLGAVGAEIEVVDLLLMALDLVGSVEVVVRGEGPNPQDPVVPGGGEVRVVRAQPADLLERLRHAAIKNRVMFEVLFHPFRR